MFENRKNAAVQLSQKIIAAIPLLTKDHPQIVGIPRGGIVTASILAHQLSLPLSAIVIRKISTSLYPELAIGAVGQGKVAYWDKELLEQLTLSQEDKKTLLATTYQEVEEREMELLPFLPRKYSDTIILVDDGVATGATVICAQKIAIEKGARVILLATPVISEATYTSLRQYFHDIIYLEKPHHFESVGQFYNHFPQITTHEVLKILSKLKH